MRLLKFILLYITSLLIKPFLKINPNLLVFSARGGQGFEGNSKYLFLYCINHTKYECYWIIKNKEIIFENISSDKIIYYFSIKALIISLRAKAIFFTHSHTDAMPISYKKKTRLIYLWHGIPIKKVGFQDKNLGVKSKIFNYIKSKKINFIISNSKAFNEIYKESFKLKDEQIVITGLPRIEFLKNPKKFIKDIQNPFESNKKIYLYAPTFRDYVFNYTFLSSDNLEKINNELIKQNALLYLKFHPQDKYQFSCDYSQIKLFKFKVDIYEVLPFVDSFISDYSSLIIDFLVAYPEKDLKIFVPDINQYEKLRGFCFGFNRVFDSKIITKFNDFSAPPQIENINFKDFFYDKSIKNESSQILQKVFNL